MSSTFHFFSRQQLPVTPWKNGGGSTREIVCWPPGAGLSDFHWRVSIASIAQPGPFSVFEGIDRHIMLLDGDGVRLQSHNAHDGRVDHRLERLNEPFAFSGDLAIDCSLLGGPSSDFNVMARRACCRAELQLIQGGTARVEAAPHGLLYALRGAWSVAPNTTLASHEGLWWADAAQAWQAQGTDADALLLAVRIIEA